MNVERLVTDRLHRDAAGRAPRTILDGALQTIAATPQDRVLWRPRVIGANRSSYDRRLFALGATIVTLGLLGALALSGGRNPAPMPSPTPSPRASSIGLAYGLDGDIYVSNWDGTNPIRIADGDPVNRCATFLADGGLTSPSGRMIAYRSGWNDVCEGSVHLADAAGHPITSFPGVGWNITWSPDSTRLATWTTLFGDIGVYGVDGVRQAVLDGSGMCCGDRDPIWSPDGAESILVKSSASVIELPLDGRESRVVQAGDPRAALARGWGGKVAYSPDRSRAAVVDVNSLFVEWADGTSRRTLEGPTSDPPASILWSPTGEWIAILRSATTDDRIEILNPQTMTSRTVAVPGEGFSISNLIGFSADGQWLLFAQNRDGDLPTNPSLWIANVDATGARMVVQGTSEGGWLDLTPESER